MSALLPHVALPQRVPPVPAPPHDPSSLLLAGHIGPQPEVGWAVARLQGAELAAGAPSLVLQPTPSALRRMSEPSGSFGGLRMPLNAALGPAGDVYLLDPESVQLKRFDPCACRFEPVPCFLSGAASEPHGIAICGGDVAVADSGHGRVLRFAMNGFISRGALALPRAEAKKLAPRRWYPFALAFDGRGRLYVSDPRNQRIDVFDAQGRWRGAHATSGSPWLLALDCADRLYAVVSQSAQLALESRNDGAGARWRWSADPADLAVLVLDGAWRAVDERSAHARDFARAPMPIDARGHLHLACASDGEALFDARGLRLRPESRAQEEIYLRAGEYRSRALDSGIEGCQWHRVELRGALPDGCAVRVSTLCAHVELGEEDLALLPPRAWSEAGLAARMDRCGRWDCLVKSPPGRFLWLRLELSGDGHATPALAAALIEFPRLGLRRYLPAVFGADPAGADFTDRFTALFDTALRSIERRLDGLAAFFDPLSAPSERKKGAPDFLTWIASWIGLALSRDWPETRRRHYVKEAARLYCLRGTPLGLWRQLLLFLGLDDERRCLAERPQRRCVPLGNCWPEPQKTAAAPPPLILEHFKLRRWLHVGRGKLGEDAVLWGKKIVGRSQLSAGAQVGATRLDSMPDPLRDPFHVTAHRFSVFVPARVGKDDGERRALEQLLAREAPAHTLYDVRYVEPRFRVGVQAMLGLDSVIARTPRDVTLGDNALGQGSVLGAPPARRGGPKLRVGEARVGSTTVLT